MNCLHFKYTLHIPVKSYSTKTHSIPHHQSINKKQQNISYPNVTPALRYCVSQVKYQGNQQCTARTNKRWNDACSVIQVSAYSSGQDCTVYSHLQASGHFNWWGYTQIFLAQLHLLKTIPCFILCVTITENHYFQIRTMLYLRLIRNASLRLQGKEAEDSFPKDFKQLDIYWSHRSCL